MTYDITYVPHPPFFDPTCHFIVTTREFLNGDTAGEAGIIRAAFDTEAKAQAYIDLMQRGTYGI